MRATPTPTAAPLARQGDLPRQRRLRRPAGRRRRDEAADGCVLERHRPRRCRRRPAPRRATVPARPSASSPSSPPRPLDCVPVELPGRRSGRHRRGGDDGAEGDACLRPAGGGPRPPPARVLGCDGLRQRHPGHLRPSWRLSIRRRRGSGDVTAFARVPARSGAYGAPEIQVVADDTTPRLSGPAAAPRRCTSRRASMRASSATGRRGTMWSPRASPSAFTEQPERCRGGGYDGGRPLAGLRLSAPAAAGVRQHYRHLGGGDADQPAGARGDGRTLSLNGRSRARVAALVPAGRPGVLPGGGADRAGAR